MIDGRAGVAGCAASGAVTGGLVMNARCRSVTAPGAERRSWIIVASSVQVGDSWTSGDQAVQAPPFPARTCSSPSPFQLAPTSWNVRGATIVAGSTGAGRSTVAIRTAEPAGTTDAPDGETSPSAAVASIAAQMRKVIRRIGERAGQGHHSLGPQPRGSRVRAG